MRESRIEKELTDQIKAIGGLAWKFVSPGARGVPDRIVILPHGRIIFVELKRPGEKPDPLQLKRHRQLREKGHVVHVIDTIEGVKDFIKGVMPK
ncbi:VRR-NUC domain-containing protein [Geosporobacter ferrireducens]|uniref:VRR-NUC domain-containing protein n=1 Tax=Geosporobacter ferrireducens TaxID=1424294 RepID=UPI00139CCA1B|nr:VRR-NUC domain-containing protein [Geosporobacter ferrireducens]MTI56137.1 VRR-NUC domain-containing protein [Geosporobacter ferrireducens]